MTLITHVIGPPTAERVLLLIHGYGADEQDLGGLLPYLDPEGHFRTVLPARSGGRTARVLLVRHRLGGRRAHHRRDLRLVARGARRPPRRGVRGARLEPRRRGRGRVLPGRRSRRRARPASQRPAPPGGGPRDEHLSPRRRGRRLRLGRGRGHPGARAARHRGPAHPGRAGRPAARAGADRPRRAHRLLRVPDGPRRRPREHAGSPGVARRGARPASRPPRPCPRRRPSRWCGR